MYIRPTATSRVFTVVPVRGFEDSELPLSEAEQEAVKGLLEDHNQIQWYLRGVWELLNQGAYEAARNLEKPECLKTAVARAGANDEKPRRKKATAQRSSTTSQSQPKQSASNTSTSPKTES